MYWETWLPLNTLLRLSVPLAILTGLLDVSENLLLLQNIQDWVSQPALRTIVLDNCSQIHAGRLDNTGMAAVRRQKYHKKIAWD